MDTMDTLSFKTQKLYESGSWTSHSMYRFGTGKTGYV